MVSGRLLPYNTKHTAQTPVPLDADTLSELRHTLEPWLTAHGYCGNFDTQRRAQEVPAAEYLSLAQKLSDNTTASCQLK